jgi:hypothetical protein
MNAVPKLPKVLGSFPSPAPTKSSRGKVLPRLPAAKTKEDGEKAGQLTGFSGESADKHDRTTDAGKIRDSVGRGDLTIVEWDSMA